jgi:phage protein D
MAEQASGVTDVWVQCGSHKPVEDSSVHSMVVDQDTDQPDMCVLTLNNASHSFSNDVRLGDEVEVKIGGSGGKSIFKGEVVGLEPVYKTGGESKCIVRAFNRLHRLLRGRRSMTFMDKKDSEIAKLIAQANKLTASTEDTAVAHKHVYQHNQTDLDFLRLIAARNGFEVMCEDKTLHFRKPRADKESGVELRINEAASGGLMLKTFSPRLSSAGLVKEVEVRSWNAEKKEEIVARATAARSSLGSRMAPSEADAFGERITFTVDRPVSSVEEAKKLAEAKLADILMDFIVGDGLCVGSPEIQAGTVIKITVNPDQGDDRFNGKYFVTGASHRYSHSSTGGSSEGQGGGGYVTSIRVRRDAAGGGQ